MTNELLTIPTIINQLRITWSGLPDGRRPSNNTKHLLEDVVSAAFAVFFLQQPSFLALQEQLREQKGQDNAQTLFQISKIPSDNQIRNILDHLSPETLHQNYNQLHRQLKEGGWLEAYQAETGTYHIAFDGVTYHGSTEISCPNCNHKKGRGERITYSHGAVLAVMVCPDSPHVLACPPECLRPQDGHEKQDCERAAVKRWLTHHASFYEPQSVTFLGDDLYSTVPLCQLITQTYQQHFLFVCKPTSHPTLYDHLATLQKVNGVEEYTLIHRNPSQKRYETWQYRFVNEIPLTASEETLLVNWLELTITNQDTGQLIFHNSWISDHYFKVENSQTWAKVGRSRWKVENEGINILKQNGYHLEHNFGHGQNHLCNFLFTLNILAFLVHTIQHLVDEAYILLRQTLRTRQKFFNDLKALTTYLLFESWEALFQFMLDGLNRKLSPKLPP